MNRTEIEATRDAIAKYPNNFDMSQTGWTNAIVRMDDCGTTGCIAGYTLARHGKLADGVILENRLLFHAREILGLTQRQERKLFEPKLLCAHYRAIKGDRGYVSPNMAVACLNILLETGRVLWFSAYHATSDDEWRQE